MEHWITVRWIIVNLLYYISNKKTFHFKRPYQKIDLQPKYEKERKKSFFRKKITNRKSRIFFYRKKNELEFTLNTKLSRNGEDNLKEGIHFVFRHQSETQKRFSKREVEEWSFLMFFSETVFWGIFHSSFSGVGFGFEHSLLKVILVRRARRREAKEFNGPLFSTILDSTAAKKTWMFSLGLKNV